MSSELLEYAIQQQIANSVEWAMASIREAAESWKAAAPAPSTPTTFPRKWEDLNSLRLNRLKVPGGWLVCDLYGGSYFVPDPTHAWVLDAAPATTVTCDDGRECQCPNCGANLRVVSPLDGREAEAQEVVL